MDSDNSENYDQEFWDLIEEEFMDDSDEEQQLQNERQSGSSSRPKRRTTIGRDALGNHDEYFQMRVGATGKMGLSPLQKCTSAICMLAYGSHADFVDEYVRIGESTSIECLQRFVQGVNVVFGDEYLRKPNNTDVEHLLQMGESRGFPDMLGSIDCMHWEWKNCPVAWKGQYCRGDHGSNNDINVLNQSNVFNDILEGHAPNVQYTINGTPYNMGYYLADGIYPE
ncbi:unnamed protein product [Vicia faba]|uniref:Uncharacterized protein n=1 Tax=Vicia faba TaxID=3906 RepID=A0AAV1AQK3_VICFA|nr:unnamed protein product [Vicia faba]